MIQSLKIENFQSHKSTQLDFCEGINVVTGNSNCGKTAILRALNWVITNKPTGLSYKSSFSDKKEDCKVSIVVNGHVITKTKNTSTNKYEIDNTLFDVVGGNVPTEVSTILNMDDINSSSQFDKHFLITDSAGEVGRTINKIVNLDIIDELISSLNSKVLSTNKEIEFRKSDITELENSLCKFKNIDEIELLVTSIVKFNSDVKEDETIIYSLEHMAEGIKKSEATIILLENKFGNLEIEIDILDSFCVDYNANEQVYKKTKYVLDSLDAIEESIYKAELVTGVEDKIIRFENSYNDLNKKISDLSGISAIINEWNLTSIRDLENKIKDSEEAFDKVIKELVCPLCGRKN